MTPEEMRLFRARQRSRAMILAIVLGALAILFFVVTIAKIQAGHA